MEVTAGLAESNGNLLPGLWRDSLHVTCGLTACTPGSASGPTLGNGFTFLVPTYPGCPGKQAAKWCNVVVVVVADENLRGLWHQCLSVSQPPAVSKR